MENITIENEYCQDKELSEMIFGPLKNEKSGRVRRHNTNGIGHTHLTAQQKRAYLEGSWQIDLLHRPEIEKKHELFFITLIDFPTLINGETIWELTEKEHKKHWDFLNKKLRKIGYKYTQIIRTERKKNGTYHSHFIFVIEKKTMENFKCEVIKQWEKIVNRQWENEFDRDPDDPYRYYDLYKKAADARKVWQLYGARRYAAKWRDIRKENPVKRPWSIGKTIKDFQRKIIINIFENNIKSAVVTLSQKSVKVEMKRGWRAKKENITSIRKTQCGLLAQGYFEKFRKTLPYLIQQKYQFGFLALTHKKFFLKTYPEIWNAVNGLKYINNPVISMQLIKDNGVIKLIPKIETNTKRKSA